MPLQVASLCVYPLKGARGIEVQAAKVTDTGLAFDRHFVVVNDSSSGRFETQRSEPRLALIETHLPDGCIVGQAPPDACLTLSAPGQQPLRIPLQQTGELRAVKVWDWAGEGHDMGSEAAQWLSQYFGKPVRLLRYAGTAGQGSADADPTRRPVDASWTQQQPSETAFSDAFPLLLASEASLAALNASLPEGSAPLKMNRFRPNLVVGGAEAWQEDGWQALTVSGVRFLSAKPCDRCKVTTTVQETGEPSADREPLRTLARLRSGAVLGWDAAQPKWRSDVFFGWNLIPCGSGVVRVGDPLEAVQPRTALPGAAA